MALKIPVPSKRAEGGNGNGYTLPPEGNHPAVLVALVELGTQLRKGFGGEADTWKPMVYLGFELTGEDDHPVVGIAYTVSMNEKANLRAAMKELRGGKDFTEGEDVDLALFLGKPCMVTIDHELKGERTIAKLSGVARYPKIPPPAAPKNQPVAWEFTPTGAFPKEGFLAGLYLWGKPLPQWVREAKERKPGAEAPPSGVNDDRRVERQTPFTQAGQEDPIPF